MAATFIYGSSKLDGVFFAFGSGSPVKDAQGKVIIVALKLFG
jgi:hypothetical protein